jgi:NADPH-dependent ferric siderophore reductase
MAGTSTAMTENQRLTSLFLVSAAKQSRVQPPLACDFVAHSPLGFAERYATGVANGSTEFTRGEMDRCAHNDGT